MNFSYKIVIKMNKHILSLPRLDGMYILDLVSFFDTMLQSFECVNFFHCFFFIKNMKENHEFHIVEILDGEEKLNQKKKWKLSINLYVGVCSRRLCVFVYMNA